jgi:hypothetical protein
MKLKEIRDKLMSEVKELNVNIKIMEIWDLFRFK